MYSPHANTHVPSHRAPRRHTNMDNQLPPETHAPEVSGGPEISGVPEVSGALEGHRPINASRVFYGVMFDAGSTGTRIHIYKFIQKDPVGLPVLDNEMYHAVKPGLSAYADKPEEGGETIRLLLRVAKKTIPKPEWPHTPVVLKATAGLRLLPPEKAKALLDEVKEVFDESPFFVPSDSVSIMNGTNEGILAWVTVNFLTGHLYAKTKKTVGILDLGGGSTQITFLPKSKKTVMTAPPSYIARFDMFNDTYELYTHSYLGNGIVAARLATLGALGADGNDLSGIRLFAGYAGYKLCYHEVMRVVKGIIHQPFEVKGNSVFFAFSYYYDRAVESGLIDGTRGGVVEVRDFKKRAKEGETSINPFLCMDMTYITCLLKEGFGFKDSTVLQLTKKVNNVETSWALGATFDHLHNLNIH
uniref:nucleoside diphosphate phosphatase n=1 Tax=Denticeps clupeoides TaxID=299321 RepID=A0AAY4B1K6_9TELE